MITLRTLFGYLVGHAASIRRVAGHPLSLWIGFAFVVAAGFAREYDGEDLTAVGSCGRCASPRLQPEIEEGRGSCCRGPL